VFQLYLPVTNSTLVNTKIALTHALPDIKSSHRCEAMARGFGYRTYASFLLDARSSEESMVLVDGRTFVDYLARHGFDVAGVALYHAASKAALQSIAMRFPRLTAHGFGIGERNAALPVSEWRARFADSRAELVSDHAIKPFLASLAFLSRVERTKTIRPKTSSYWLKHLAEKFACTYPDGEKLGAVYVPNGLLIAAAIHAGFDVKPYIDDHGREALNACFNMKAASLYGLDCEINPNGSRARAKRDREWQSAARRISFAA
jgi:hypothetical protein